MHLKQNERLANILHSESQALVEDLEYMDTPGPYIDPYARKALLLQDIAARLSHGDITLSAKECEAVLDALDQEIETCADAQCIEARALLLSQLTN